MLPSLWFSLLPSARAWREPRGWAAFPRRPRSPPLGASPGYHRLQRSASTSLGSLVFGVPPATTGHCASRAQGGVLVAPQTRGTQSVGTQAGRGAGPTMGGEGVRVCSRLARSSLRGSPRGSPPCDCSVGSGGVPHPASPHTTHVGGPRSRGGDNGALRGRPSRVAGHPWKDTSSRIRSILSGLVCHQT